MHTHLKCVVMTGLAFLVEKDKHSNVLFRSPTQALSYTIKRTHLTQAAENAPIIIGSKYFYSSNCAFPILLFQLCSSNCALPIVLFLLCSSNCALPIVIFQLCSSSCDLRNALFQLCSSNCALPVVILEMRSSYCALPIVLLQL